MPNFLNKGSRIRVLNQLQELKTRKKKLKERLLERLAKTNHFT
jgi:hypothetical protein